MGNRTGQWRYRVGDYRIICKILYGQLIVEVVAAGHRKDVY
jgi:mRNA interferase RelE/StbE